MAKKSFLIIGMGTFGHHLCVELAKQRCEVMAVDAVAEAVEDVLSLVVSAKVGDCTNEEVLRSFGIPDFDACFVCVSSDFKNSLQITSLLKELQETGYFSDLQVYLTEDNKAYKLDERDSFHS